MPQSTPPTTEALVTMLRSRLRDPRVFRYLVRNTDTKRVVVAINLVLWLIVAIVFTVSAPDAMYLRTPAESFFAVVCWLVVAGSLVAEAWWALTARHDFQAFFAQVSAHPEEIQVAQTLRINSRFVMVYRQPAGAQPVADVLAGLVGDDLRNWQIYSLSGPNDRDYDGQQTTPMINEKRMRELLTARVPITVLDFMPISPKDHVNFLWPTADAGDCVVLVGPAGTKRYVMNKPITTRALVR